MSDESPVLLLRENDEERLPPVRASAVDAATIAITLEQEQLARPLTQDLLVEAFAQLAGEFQPQLTIESMEDGVFYTGIVVDGVTFDTRPSDVVAVAVRRGQPIHCPTELLDEVGISDEITHVDEVGKFRGFLDQVQLEDFWEDPAPRSWGGTNPEALLEGLGSTTVPVGVSPTTGVSGGQRQQCRRADGRGSLGADTVVDGIRHMDETPQQDALFDGDFAPVSKDLGFRDPVARKVVGIAYRQLDYWARTSLVVPEIRGAPGSGLQRLYSFRDILLLRVVRRSLDIGTSLQRIRIAVDYLRARGVEDLAELTPVSDGSSVYEHTAANELFNLTKGGQDILLISISSVWQEIEETLDDLPGE